MKEEEEEEDGQSGGRANPKGVSQSVNQKKRRTSVTGRKGGIEPAGVRTVDKFGRMLPPSVGRLG